MRSVVMLGPEECCVQETDEPAIAAGKIKLRTRICSILAENVGMYTGVDPRLKSADNPLYRGYPLTQAGEVLAEVVEVGEGVEEVSVGDRFVSYAPYHEYHLVAPDAWTRLDPEVADEAGISLGFSATTLHCVRRAQIQIGDNVLIIGQGPMGAMVTAWARMAGAGRVIALDLYPRRLEVARQMGATHAINGSEDDVVARLRELTDGLGPDIVIDAGNSPKTLPLAMDLAREKGRIVVLSWHTHPITIEDITRDFYHKELEILATRASGPPHAYRSPWLRWTGKENQLLIARLMAEGRYDPSPLVTHRMPVAEIVKAMEQLLHRPAQTLKVLVDW